MNEDDRKELNKNISVLKEELKKTKAFKALEFIINFLSKKLEEEVKND